MKSKLLSTFSMLRFFIVAALTVFCVSCDKTETTDSTGFILHYLGVTDIGPGMSYTLQAPTYKGSAPYDFTITKVTLNEETFSNNDNFVINAETGEITIQNTDGMTSGMYSISVGCYSNGKFFDFKDAVQVNMLLAVPEGVTVEPAEVLVNQDEENWAEASAQVSTEADKHVSITGYAIAQDETKPYLSYFTFDPNTKGKIIIRESEKDKLVAGESYTLNLKLTTKAGEHMYNNAVTFKVVSKPRDLFYIETEALPDLFETGTENKSVIPTIAGAKEELKFAIKSVTPETTAFTINEATGQISVPEGNSLEISETPYVFTITASNAYGSNDFEGIYSVKVVAFIEPIQPETFNYTPVNKLYQLGGSLESQKPDEGFVGGAPTFQFDESNSEEIKAQIAQNIISINSANGAISIANNHTLSAMTHEIKVKVTNKKNEEGVVKALSVTVVENPNDFTYVSWGTNIEHEIIIGAEDDYFPKKETNIAYRNQFRFINRNWGVNGNKVENIEVLDSDIPAGSTASYKLIGKFPNNNNFPQLNVGSILENGTISTNNGNSSSLGGSNSAAAAILLIEVTSSNNEAPAVKKNIPVFFNSPENVSTGTLLFTPFVVRINPHTGQCSTTTSKVYEWKNHKFNKEVSAPNIAIDYRTNFSYWNFDNNQNHASGDLKANTSTDAEMLFQVWNNCGFSKPSDMGTRVPLCYYDTQKEDYPGPGNLTAKAGYIDATTHQIVINPEKWKGKDGLYPNGVVIGHIHYVFDGNANRIHNSKYPDGTPVTPADGKGYSLFLWFDETYEGN